MNKVLRDSETQLRELASFCHLHSNLVSMSSSCQIKNCLHLPPRNRTKYIDEIVQFTFPVSNSGRMYYIEHIDLNGG